MATIDEELNVAEQAHEALNTLTTITIDEALNAFSKAKDIAKAQQAVTSLSSEVALNNSRHEVVIASNDLIRSSTSDRSSRAGTAGGSVRGRACDQRRRLNGCVADLLR
jgi:hypothetical protein